MSKKTSIFYILGLLTVAVLLLVGLLAVDLVRDAKGKIVEKPRFDLPNDVPWDKIPWKEFPENFPYDEVPWEELPSDTPWEDVDWENVPWDKLPDGLAAKLPLDKIPWDSLPEDMPWDSLPDDIPWENVPWEDVPWTELPQDFPWEEVPWDDIPEDFNWKALTCEHEFDDVRTLIPATCVTGGVDIYTCGKCGYAEPRQTEPTGEHVFEGEWLVETAATCVDGGMEYRVCVQCHTERETQPTEPTGIHTYDGEGKCLYCQHRRITVSSDSATKQYDGTPLSATDCNVTFGELHDGDELVVESYTSLNAVSVAPNVVTVRVQDENGNDVTDNYDIDYAYGSLTLSEKQLTITTSSAEQTYNGKPLTCREFMAEGLAQGDSVQVITATSLTECGSCSNVLTIRIVNEKGEDVTANYSIMFVYGTLTVTA